MSAAVVTALPVPAHTPFEGVSTRELETELLGLAGHIAAAQCRFLRLLAEFDRRNGWEGPGLRSCAHWLSWRAGMSVRTAVEQLRVAHALERLPRIVEAFGAGRVSYSKVRAITRIAGTDADTLAAAGAATNPATDPKPDPKPDPEPDPDCDVTGCPATGCGETGAAAPDPEAAERVLLDLALAGTASHVETVVRAVRRRRTPPPEPAARRGVSWHWDEDGSLVLRARFTPDQGAQLVAQIEALIPPRTPVAHPVPEPPPGWEQRAIEQEPGPAVERVAARRGDALMALVTGEAPTSEDGSGGEGAPVVARGHTDMVVHLDVDTGAARIQGGPELAPATAARLACDARVQLLLDDRRHNRLYLGRRRRLASPAQIAALTARDGARCQFPGCTHTRHLHAHHIVHWLHGGRTDLDNLILVCSFHHGVIHDHGYLIRWGPGGWQFRRPDGSPVPAGVPLTGDVEGLIEMATRAGLRITRDSLTPTWGGERLDPEPILDVLLPRHTPAAA